MNSEIDIFGEQEPRPIPSQLEPINFLGEGGMGSVYQINSTTAAKYIEIVPKVVPWKAEVVPVSVRYLKNGVITLNGQVLSLERDEWKILKQAIQEYRAMEELRGVPAVVQPKGYDFVESGSSLGIRLLMSYIPGKTLSEHLDDGLPLRDAAKATADTATALDSFARYDLVHGDVKPKNVMYTPGGTPGQGEATLIDFGLTRKEAGRPFLSESGLSRDLHRLLMEQSLRLRPGSFGGTPGYFSPEHVRGELLTHTSDIFGLGLLAFAAFTGTEAFPSPAYGGNDGALSRMVELGMYNEKCKQSLVARLREYVLPVDLITAIGFALDEVPQRRQLEPLQREAQKLAETSIDTIIRTEPDTFCHRTTHFVEEKSN